MTRRPLRFARFAVLLAAAPLCFLLASSCSTPMVGLETRRIDVPTTGAEPARVRELAAAVTAKAATLDLEDLLGRAIAKAATGAMAGEHFADLRRERIRIRLDRRPMRPDSILPWRHSSFGPNSLLGLDDDEARTELGDADLLLVVNVEAMQWPEREGFTTHPELLCARAEVLWLSVLGDSSADLAVADATADLAVDWIAGCVLQQAAAQGIACHREDPPQGAGG